jgi:hypothetical protein
MIRITPVVAGFLLLACMSPNPHAVPAHEIRSRLRGVSIGQSIAEVHDTVRADAVRMPGNRDATIATPIHTIEFESSAGAIRVEVYVVGAWRSDRCTGFDYQDIPVSYVNGRVVSKQWDYLEWRWQGWGGSIAELRSAQDRFACPPESTLGSPTARAAFGRRATTHLRSTS